MADSATPSISSRPRPVVLYGAFTAALGAFLGFAGLTDLMPKTVIAWVALVGAVVTAAGAVLVQNTVTPLADPQDARGVPLTPVDVAEAKTAQAVAEATATPGGLVFPPDPAMRQLPTTTGNPVIPD